MSGEKKSNFAFLCILNKDGEKRIDSIPSSYNSSYLSFNNPTGISIKRDLNKYFLKFINSIENYEITLLTRYNLSRGNKANIWLINNNQVLICVDDIYFFRSTIDTNKQYIKLSKKLMEKPFVDIDFEKESLREEIDILREEIDILRDDFDKFKSKFKDL